MVAVGAGAGYLLDDLVARGTSATFAADWGAAVTAPTAEEVAKVGGRAVHLLLGGNYHEARLTNAVVERHLGVATNRNITVLRTLAEKWGE